ncbi:MAG: hypothetical protein CTR55_00375 [Pseudomonas sp.]|nr:MAG: hypothetical protein CTR55_00375 [Pseudomonas sp.]
MTDSIEAIIKAKSIEIERGSSRTWFFDEIPIHRVDNGELAYRLLNMVVKLTSNGSQGQANLSFTSKAEGYRPKNTSYFPVFMFDLIEVINGQQKVLAEVGFSGFDLDCLQRDFTLHKDVEQYLYDDTQRITLKQMKCYLLRCS